MKKKIKLPYGFRDYFPKECYNKELLENALAEIYKSHGYFKAETPTVEYYDTFHDVYQPEKLKNTFKLTDNDGSLLALRPDITLQICRMAAGMDLKTCKRVYYNLSSFEYMDDDNTARTREFAQSGVELLGKSGVEGDAEIVMLALKSLKAAGLDDYTVEIGNNEFFKGLIDECGLNEPQVKELTSLINRKDVIATEIFLQKQKISEELARIIMNMPMLFGREDVFDRAEKFCKNSRTAAALNDLRILYEILSKCGYAENISIDLGMLNGLDYYSGLVVKGYSKKLGLCLLDGGRYDGICRSFGYDSGAVGFAIGIDRILSILNSMNKLKDIPKIDYAYCCIDSDPKLEQDIVDKLRKKGLRVVKIFEKSMEMLKNYCKENGVKNAFCIENDKIMTISGEGAL